MLLFALVLALVFVLAWLLRPQKDIPRSRKFAMLIVIFCFLALALVAVIFQVTHNASGDTGVSSVSNALVLAALFCFGAAVLSSGVLALTHQRETAKGAGFGICVSAALYITEVVVLGWLGGV
jgi:hypothetical protein